MKRKGKWPPIMPIKPDPPMTNDEIVDKTKKMELDILDTIRRGDEKKITTFPFRWGGADSRLAADNHTIVYPAISREVHIEKIIGPTATIYSILCERPSLLYFFLARLGADIEYTRDGWTLLHFACATRDTGCLRMLLRMGAWTYLDRGIRTPLGTTTGVHIAVQHGLYETVLVFVRTMAGLLPEGEEAHADLSAPNAFGMTPLHVAVAANDWDMIQILINSGARLAAVNADGLSPYDMAKRKGLGKLVELFENGEIESPSTLDQRHLYHTNQNAVHYRAKFYDTVSAQLEQLEGYIKVIEARVAKDNEETCILCEDALGQRCPTCGEYLCESCMTNAQHRCNNRRW